MKVVNIYLSFCGFKLSLGENGECKELAFLANCAHAKKVGNFVYILEVALTS